MASIFIGALAVGFVGGEEGVSTKAYRDVVGAPTIWLGQTRGVKIGDTPTMDECKTMLGDALVALEGICAPVSMFPFAPLHGRRRL
jgi:GH24 family phage-related lysozyme (muramidase)